MKTTGRLIVEIDVDFYTTAHNSSTIIYTPREGTIFQRMPNHGELAINIKGSNIPDGAKVYFHHFAVDTLFKHNGKSYVACDPSDILAYEQGGELKAYSRIIGKRIERQDYLDNEKAIIKLPDVPRWETHCFEVLDNPTDIKANKGDKIWMYTNKDYIIEYIDHLSFIEAPYVVYNETTGEMLEPWTMIRTHDSEDQYEKRGMLWVPKKAGTKRVQATVVKGCYDLEEGDEVLFARTDHNSIPFGKDINVINYKYIRACLN